MTGLTAAGVGMFSAAGIAAAPSTAAHSRARLSALAGQASLSNSRSRIYLAAPIAAMVPWGFGLRPAAVLAAIAAASWIAARRRRRRRELDATRAAVVELCRATAAELRSGQPAGRALVTAGQLMPHTSRAALAPSFAAAAQGAESELGDLLMTAAVQPGLSGLSRLAACWGVAASAGSALAPALDRIADGLQDEIDVRRDIATSMAGPRATVRLLAILPAIGLALGTAIGADPVSFLFGSSAGIGCLAGAVILDVAGLAWARRIATTAAHA